MVIFNILQVEIYQDIKYQANRVSSFFGDELIMGSYISRLFPLLFALFLIKKNKNMKFIL